MSHGPLPIDMKGVPSGDVDPRAAQLYRAIRFVLDRIQDTPDVRYYCGQGTQIFYELVQAEAAFLGLPLADVEARRQIDIEPAYRKTRPQVIRLNEQLEAARRNCTCGGAQ